MTGPDTMPSDAGWLGFADTDAEIFRCYPLMRQLRPHLASEQELVARWRRQVSESYRVLALWQETVPVALAGFRVQENLVYGLHLYVDDLVTDEAARGGGHGAVLIQRLQDEGRALGCVKLVLDTALANSQAQRFYHRNRLSMTAVRFSIPLSGEGA